MNLINKIYNNKIFKFFYNIVKTLLFGILILYVAFIVIQRISGNQSILGYRVFTVATGSMVPVYNVNDIIVVKDVDANELNIGDDVAYMGSSGDFKDKLVTHRIINKETDKNGNIVYETKGVANSAADPKINASQIYGKVIGKLVGINIINHVVKSQIGFFFLIFIPLVLVIFLEVADTIVEMKLEKHQLEEIKNKEEITEKTKLEEVKIVEESKPSDKESDEDEELI